MAQTEIRVRDVHEPPTAHRAGGSHRPVRARTAAATPDRSASTRSGRCGSCSAARRTGCSRRPSRSTSSRWASRCGWRCAAAAARCCSRSRPCSRCSTRAYGAFLLTLPWNPYLPVLWWFVFVLAVWSVLADDLAMLPVAVFAGSFCMQTHISYLGLIGGLVFVTVVVLGWRAYKRATRRRCEPLAVEVGRDRRRVGCGVVDRRRSSTSSRTRPGTSASSATTSATRPTRRSARTAASACCWRNSIPWKLLTRTLVHDGGALEVDGLTRARRAPPGCVRGVGVRGVAAPAPAPAPARRGDPRRARARPRVVGAHLRDGVVLPVAVGVGPRRVDAVRDRVGRRSSSCGRASYATCRRPTRAPSRGRAPWPLPRSPWSSSGVFAFQASSVTVQTPRLNDSLGALIGPTTAALRQLEAHGATRSVPRHVAARRRGDRVGRFRPPERARPARLRRAGRGGVPARRDPLPRDRRAHADARGAPRDRPRHRELAARLAVHAGRVLRPALRRGARPVRRGCTPRWSAISGRPGSADLVPQVDNNLFMLALATNVPDRARSTLDLRRCSTSACRWRCSSARPEMTDPTATIESAPSERAERDGVVVPARAGRRRRARARGAGRVRVRRLAATSSPGGDAFFYHAGANLLAEGKGFISPFYVKVGIHRAGGRAPAAVHRLPRDPVGARHEERAHAPALVVRARRGDGVARRAARARSSAARGSGSSRRSIAALYPNLWAPDGQLQAETLSMFAATRHLVARVPVLAASELAPPRARRRRVRPRRARAFGARSCSSRSLVVPLVWTHPRSHAGAERCRWLGASVAAAVIVIAPWTIYNSTRFAHPVLLSAQFDPLLASANCDSTYYGDLQGYFDINCAIAIAERQGHHPRTTTSRRKTSCTTAPRSTTSKAT